MRCEKMEEKNENRKTAKEKDTMLIIKNGINVISAWKV
jgi:hypothetical protein